MEILKKYRFPLGMLLLFEGIAVTLWLTLDNLFYLFNFSYIGGFLCLGIVLGIQQRKHTRLVVQLGVGLYMLFYVGLLSGENMQLEGFWFYLFSGVFEAATIHYLVAKIGGPLLFGRGWCGYACWTAMVLDLLPYKRPKAPRRKGLDWLRFLLFALSLAFVLVLFWLAPADMEHIMFVAFLLGNLFYYAAGILLAYKFQDNRAFCKYLCPITVFLKPMSHYALLRVRVDEEACTDCGACKKVCPMDVDMTSNARNRDNATECILCTQCIDICPQKALKL